MALVGNISGSSSSSSIVGVTGSVIFANRPDALFPSSLPGGDISFFVSGAIGGKGNTAERTVAVFGGDVAVSGSLTVGTGSVTITSNDIQFGSSVMKIAKDGNDLKFFDITNPTGFTLSALASGGGGGGSNTVFVDGGTKAYTTSSIVIGKAQYANSIATNVFFYVSGSNAGDADAVLAGDTVVSGSVAIRDNDSVITIGYGPSSGVGQITSLNGNLVLDTVGGSRVIIDTDHEIAGTNIYAGGGGGVRNIFTDNDTPAKLITIGGAGGKTTIGGGLEVTGNYISGSAGVNLTLGSAGAVTVAGDLTVTGNDISGSAGVNLTLESSGDVTVAGDLTVAGNDIKSSTATALTLAGTQVTAQGNLIVKGDLYISGTTTTIDSTVVEIQDPVVGLGFASGSVAGLAGDRGLIGGITGAGNNVALIWSQNSGSFVATRTTSSPGASPVVISNLLPVRAAKLEVNGTAAYITSSDTRTLELNGSSGNGIKFTIGSSTPFAKFVDNGAIAEFGAISNKQLNVSGAQVNINASGPGTVFQRDGTAFASLASNAGLTNMTLSVGTGYTAATIVNTIATTVNFAGAATTISIGAGSGRTTVNNDLATATGNIIGAPGSGANVMSLLSSGNIIAKLDVDNNGAGHQFQIQDYLGINQFVVGENGNAEISGSLTVSGSSISTLASTFGLVNTTAATINFGGGATNINVGNAAGTVTFAGDIAVNGGDITTTSGTFQLANANATTVSMAGAATTLNIANGATFAQTLNLATASTGSSTYNLMTGATATSATKTVNLGTGGLAGSTTNVNIGSGLGGTTVVTGSFQSKGSITLGDTDGDTLTFTARAGSNLLPNADTTYDLGSPSLRWRNMYTGDLHLRNERGDWTIIEEAEYLSITNNLSGRRYKFVLEEL